MEALESSFRDIATVLAQAAPAGWTSILLDAKVDDGVVQSQFDWIDDQGQSHFFMVPTVQRIHLADAVLALREGMKGDNAERFSACTFELFGDGTFGFDAEYPD